LSLSRLANCLEKSVMLHSQLISGLSPDLFMSAETQKTICLQKDGVKKPVGSSYFTVGSLWSEMNVGFHQLTEFGVNIRSAKHELRLFTTPHFIPIKSHLRAFDALTTLYTQVVTFLATLDLDPPKMEEFKSENENDEHMVMNTSAVMNKARHRFSRRLDSLLGNLTAEDTFLMAQGIHPAYLLSRVYVPDILAAAGMASKWLNSLAYMVKHPEDENDPYNYESKLRLLTERLSHRLMDQEFQLSKLVDKCVTQLRSEGSEDANSEINKLLSKYLVVQPSLYCNLSAEMKSIFWNRYHETRHKVHVTSESLLSFSKSLSKASKVIQALVDTNRKSRSIFSTK